MESSQVFLNKVMLNIATSKDQGLNLVKGEVLRGVVQEVKADGLVSLLIKGQVIDAVSEVPVKPGQQLQLMVEDFRDGKTYLKALTPELLERIENSNLAVNLKDIGAAAKDTNIVMAKKLLAHNLPVTVNNLNELSKGMNLLGGVNARNLEITAFAMQRGIIINQHNLNSLAQFTAPGSSLTQLVKDILQNLASLERLSADGQSVPAKQGTGEESARLQLNQASTADKSQTQSGVNNPRISAEANLYPGGKGNQEAGLQIKADNSGENAASAGKAATAETGAVLSKSGSEAPQQPGKEVLGAKTPANAEKLSMEVPKPAAGKAGPEQIFQAGEKAGSAGKANTVETGTALSKAGSEVPQQQGKEVLGTKTLVNAEKLSMEVPKPVAGKAGLEQVFQAGEKAGSEQMKQAQATPAPGIPQESVENRNTADGAKALADVSKQLA
ncbi:MAG: hypothetical protein PHC92_10175, partial [Syntrophomonadaceae bacterium]|nr:hypothetical protein [Syntrophomonadaceae bacterium]